MPHKFHTLCSWRGDIKLCRKHEFQLTRPPTRGHHQIATGTDINGGNLSPLVATWSAWCSNYRMPEHRPGAPPRQISNSGPSWFGVWCGHSVYNVWCGHSAVFIMRGLGGEGSRLLTPRQAKGAAALLFRQDQDQDQETKSIHSVNFVSMSHH